MTSNHIKTALLHSYRFEKGYKYVATEVGKYHADLLISDGYTLIEIEVKTSWFDFLNDFSKPKHKTYVQKAAQYDQSKQKQPDWPGQWMRRPYMADVPNKFFFAVPSNLIERVNNYVAEHYPNYGTIEVIQEDHQTYITMWTGVSRKSKKIHNQRVEKHTLDTITFRATSELVNLRNQFCRAVPQPDKTDGCAQRELEVCGNLIAYVCDQQGALSPVDLFSVCGVTKEQLYENCDEFDVMRIKYYMNDITEDEYNEWKNSR